VGGKTRSWHHESQLRQRVQCPIDNGSESCAGRLFGGCYTLRLCNAGYASRSLAKHSADSLITLIAKSLVRGKGAFNWKRNAVRTGALHNEGKALKGTKKALSLRTSTIPERIIVMEGFMNELLPSTTARKQDTHLLHPSWILHSCHTTGYDHLCSPLASPPHILIWGFTVASPIPIECCGSFREGAHYRGSNMRLGGERMGWIGDVLTRSARWKPMCPS